MLVLAALIAAAAPVAPTMACLDASVQEDAPVTLTGRLERHVFPGPPEYVSIRHGDRPETAYILVLDRPICMNEETVIAARAPFRRVHVFTNTDALWPRLRRAVGHRIRISGTGFAAHTGHHREPLVVDIDSLQIQR